MDLERDGARFIPARGNLDIVHIDDETYWKWVPKEGSRSKQVAYSTNVWYLQVKGEFNDHLPAGRYTLSWLLQFDPAATRTWPKNKPITFSASDGGIPETKIVEFPLNQETASRVSSSGWLEFDVLKFEVPKWMPSVSLEYSLEETKGDGKSGLYIDGVIIRPCPMSDLTGSSPVSDRPSGSSRSSMTEVVPRSTSAMTNIQVPRGENRQVVLSASESQKIHLPQGVSKLCDEVYEIYAPAAGSGVAKLEVVFIHGLQSDFSDQTSFLSAWSVRDDPSNCWLKSWLSNRFPESRIICVSYDASPVKTSTEGRLDMYTTVENLVMSLVKLGEIGQNCPVILVGHSLGGLVATTICIKVHHQASLKRTDRIMYENFRNNIRGLFFFSTPFKGVKLSSLGTLGGIKCWGLKVGQKSNLMGDLELFAEDTSRSNQEFAQLKQDYHWKTHGVVESSNTLFSGIASPSGEQFVMEASARADFLDNFNVLPNTDHFTVCRPETEKSNAFLYLENFVKDILSHDAGRGAAKHQGEN
ncbi:hypothetical protein R1flu_016792 [Riccia fluitans]|uniref:DUF676 domain-containing protein n=1 Tax=Riccia fluitans TaxID=41844 RepID=A0ABD1YND2_9MARC